jgi:hypothetical protein
MKVEILNCKSVEELINRVLKDAGMEKEYTLIKNEELDEPTPTTPPSDLGYYLDRIAHNLKVKKHSLQELFKRMIDKYPEAVRHLFLMEMAKEFDNLYPDHISDSKHVWVVSLFGHKPRELNPKMFDASNIPYTPLFRTEKEAQFAADLLSGDGK